MKYSPAGKKVTHSKGFAMGMGSVKMPKVPNMPKMQVPRDHSCKVCPGSGRSR